jgi:hypothetical protein
MDDSDVTNTKWSERLESITAFPDDFLLVWDWDTSQDQVHAKEYQDFRSGQGLSDQKSQAQKDLDRATRLWWVGRVLECVKRDTEAIKNFQRSVGIGDIVLRGADNLESSPARWGVWGDLLVEDRGGWVPLPYAVGKGYKAVVRQLLDKGAAVEAKGLYGWTPRLGLTCSMVFVVT